MPLTTQQQIDQWKAGFSPGFGKRSTDADWNDWAKWDLSGNKELDVFDDWQFGSNPGQYYNQVFNQPTGTPPPIVGDPNNFTGFQYPYPSTNTRNDVWAGNQTQQSGIQNYQQNPLNLGTFNAPERKTQFSGYTPQWQTNSLVYDPSVQSTIMTRFNQSGQGYSPEQMNTLTAAPLNTINQQERQSMRNFGEGINSMGLSNSGAFAERYGREVAPTYTTARENVASSAAAENIRQALAQEQARTEAMLNLGGQQLTGDIARGNFDLGKAASTREDFTTGLQGDTFDLNRALSQQAMNNEARTTERADVLSGLGLGENYLNRIGNFGLNEQGLGQSDNQFAANLEYLYSQMGTMEDVWKDYNKALSGTGTNVNVNTSASGGGGGTSGGSTSPFAGGIWIDPQGNMHDFRYDDAGQTINPGAGGGEPGGNRGDGSYVPPNPLEALPADAQDAYIEFMLANPDASWEEFMAWMKNGGYNQRGRGARPRE